MTANPSILYQTISPEGNRAWGYSTSLGEEECRRLLLSEGAHILKFYVIPKGLSLSRGLSISDLHDFAFEMETLLGAGLTLIEALDHVQENASKSLRGQVQGLLSDLKEGKSLVKTAENAPTLFDGFAIGLFKYAEETSHLKEAFGYWKDHLSWKMSFRNQLYSSLTYPLLLLVFLGFLMGGLLGFVVPEMESLLLSLGQTLPPETQVLLNISHGIQTHGFEMACLFLGMLTLGGILWKLTHRGRRILEKMLFSLPGIGPLFSLAMLTRLTHFLKNLVGARVNLLESIRLSQSLEGSILLLEDLQKTIRGIERGMTFSKALQLSPRMSRELIKLIALGEKTGDLPRALEGAYHYHHMKLSQKIARFTQWLQPVTLLLAGGLMGWIIYSIFLPLYDTFALLDGGIS